MKAAREKAVPHARTKGGRPWLTEDPNEALMLMTGSIPTNRMNSNTGARNSPAPKCSSSMPCERLGLLLMPFGAF